MSAPAETLAPRQLLPLGRVFLNLPFDYLAIGGGLSLLTVGALLWTGTLNASLESSLLLPLCILVFNSAHFAASTVRLYTKADAFRLWPFLTMGLPLASIAVASAAVLWPEAFGTHLFALYLTWSPFHYAAQAFGLACMYHYRSGGKLDAVERRLVYWTCMLPFLYAFVGGSSTGLRWFLPSEWLLVYPSLTVAILRVEAALGGLTFLAPLVVAIRLTARGRQGLPLISWLIILTNGIWWVVFPYYQAFLWATVFHGIQYMAIITIFHVKDSSGPGSQGGPAFQALWFCGACLVLGYLLFHVWPYAYVMAGFGLAESMLMCAAVVNLHHFIVDRYIWRLRRDPGNASVVG